MLHAPTGRIVKTSQSTLEHQLTMDFLPEKGFRLVDLKELPDNLAKELMTEASAYASLKLAEIEARSGFRRKIHFKD